MRGYNIPSIVAGEPSVFDVWNWIFKKSPVHIRDVDMLSATSENIGSRRMYQSVPWAALGRTYSDGWFYIEYTGSDPDISFIAGESPNDVLNLLSEQQLHDIGLRRR
jgi:hypothetical protein